MLLTETTTRRNASNKPAFSLPPELRLKVYELLLVHPDQSLKPNGFLHYEAGRPYLEKDYILTSILRVCRSIYEALPILYGKNTLTFHDNDFSKPVLPFPEGHFAMVKRIEIDISPVMYSSARKMGEFLAVLGTSEAKLIHLSIHIHMLEESDEPFRRSHNTLPPLPPLHLLDQFLVGDHPILGGMLLLKSVKKLYIQLEDEACFELGFTNVLKAALMKDGTADGGRSIIIEKGCTFPHGELDEEYSWCLGCGNTMDDFENGTMNWEYKDDMLSRQALGGFLFQGGKLKKAKPAKANATTGKAAKAKQPKTKAAATTSAATAKQTKAKPTKRSSKKVV